MKKMLFCLALALFARENPFVLPQNPMKAEPKQKTKVIQRTVAKNYKKVIDLGFVRVLQGKNVVKIETADSLKRAFVIDKPTKGVFDFQSKRSFLTKKVKMSKPFKNLVIGSHKGYYRIAVEVENCTPTIEATTLICH